MHKKMPIKIPNITRLQEMMVKDMNSVDQRLSTFMTELKTDSGTVNSWYFL